jgi:hypothetical protein
MFHIHTCVENTSSSFTLPLPLGSSPLHDLFCSPVLHCLSVYCSVGFCLGILPVNILYFNQSHPSITLPYPFLPPHIVQQFSLFYCFVPTQMQCILILFTPSFSSFPHPLVSFNSSAIGNMLARSRSLSLSLHIYICMYV